MCWVGSFNGFIFVSCRVIWREMVVIECLGDDLLVFRGC